MHFEVSLSLIDSVLYEGMKKNENGMTIVIKLTIFGVILKMLKNKSEK